MAKNDGKMNPQDEFGKNINKLLGLLNKMLKTHKMDGSEEARKMIDDIKNQKVNLNVFFTFMPLASEELDELQEEFELMMEQASEGTSSDELKFELDSNDKEFLKSNGIVF